MEAIPDVPEEIEIQLERTEFIVRKVIDQVGDASASIFGAFLFCEQYDFLLVQYTYFVVKCVLI